MQHIANDTDYKRFKELLEFFVGQANKNAAANKAELPVIESKNNPAKFIANYNLGQDYNKIAGLEFTIQFFKQSHFNSKNSTYINIERLNITANFENKKIEALKIEYVVMSNDDTRNLKISSYVTQKMKMLNELCECYSITELGLFNKKDPGENLKNFLNQYLEMYNSLQRYKSLSPVKE
jgi:hypothetical protein